MQKIIMLILIGFNLVLAGACIAAGFLNHLTAAESALFTLVSFGLAAFAALEFNSMEDY
jgi:hypothetical protein